MVKRYIDIKNISRKPAFFNIYCSKYRFPKKELSTYVTRKRPSHSIIYITSKTAVFDMKDGRTYTFHKNNLIYVPKGINYSSLFTGKTNKEYDCLQVFFHLIDKSGNEYYMSDVPMLLLDETPESIIDIIRDMADETAKSALSTFRVNKLFFEMMEKLSRRMWLPEVNETQSKVFPAIYYMSVHLSDDIPVPRLAQLCMMSESAFRRAFEEATGKSPALYKATLKIEKAKEFIKNDPTIASVSLVEMLGFSDTSYFYKTFQRITGISLKEYKNSLKNQ